MTFRELLNKAGFDWNDGKIFLDLIYTKDFVPNTHEYLDEDFSTPGFMQYIIIAEDNVAYYITQLTIAGVGYPKLLVIHKDIEYYLTQDVPITYC